MRKHQQASPPRAIIVGMKAIGVFFSFLSILTIAAIIGVIVVLSLTWETVPHRVLLTRPELWTPIGPLRMIVASPFSFIMLVFMIVFFAFRLTFSYMRGDFYKKDSK